MKIEPGSAEFEITRNSRHMLDFENTTSTKIRSQEANDQEEICLDNRVDPPQVVQSMENDPNEKRFRSIEGKLRLLVVLSIVQSVVIIALIVCLFIKQFMPTTLSLFLMLVVLAVFLYAFRSQIPSWFGSASRFVFSQLFDAQKSDSMKDSH